MKSGGADNAQLTCGLKFRVLQGKSGEGIEILLWGLYKGHHRQLVCYVGFRVRRKYKRTSYLALGHRVLA